MPNKVQFDTAD